jgi:uncharacterized protein YcbK (DUF882 family)
MKFKYFELEEFACQETGENSISPSFVSALDELREACGFPFKITSGYRSPSHSIEARKPSPGTHARGIAADIAINGGAQRRVIVENAIRLGFNGIGVAKTFVHVDKRETPPVMWAY